MTTRTDVIPDYYDSPRVLEVQAPSTEMIMQDLVDTARKLEDSFTGMSFKKLIDASGKEDLGGGIQVGITVSEQDTKLAFEGRTTPAETGTVTSVPGSPITGRDSFIDTAADFVAASVERGSLVVNWADRSLAEVIAVTSATQLVTKTLVNGVTNTYSASDIYHVYNIIQCNATGGNLVAVDANQISIPAVLPTAFTQVVLTSSSSATTQNQDSLNHAVFAGGVTIQAGSGFSGTVFPVGTSQEPVDNLDDAKVIAVREGFNTLFINGDWTFGATDDVDGYRLVGDAPSLSILTFVSGVNTENTLVAEANIVGDLNGALDVRRCHFEDATGIGGTVAETNIHDCLLEDVAGDTLTINPTATEDIHIINCDSGNPTSTPITVNWSDAACNGTIRKWAGGMRLTNIASGQSISFDSTGGHVTIDATCTDINLTVRGDTKVTDNRAVKTPAVVMQDTATLVWEYVTGGGFTTGQLIDLLDIINTRLDLNAAKPNVYANDGSTITNLDFTLTRTNDGTNTTVQRS